MSGVSQRLHFAILLGKSSANLSLRSSAGGFGMSIGRGAGSCFSLYVLQEEVLRIKSMLLSMVLCSSSLVDCFGTSFLPV